MASVINSASLLLCPLYKDLIYTVPPQPHSHRRVVLIIGPTFEDESAEACRGSWRTDFELNLVDCETR